MNVIRGENNFAVPRGRGRGRAPKTTEITNVAPKYDFRSIRRPLINIVPTSSNTNTSTTPNVNSSRRSAFRRRGQTPGGQISPGSITSDSESCVILAITSGRGDARGEVGIAAIDVQYPFMILCQISDSNTYINSLTKIHTLNPIEIIMPDTMCGRCNFPNSLYRAIREKFSSITITPVARMHFHESAGLDRIKTHCADEFSSVQIFVKQKYYALAAAGALFKYVEYVQHIVYAPKSMRIAFQGSLNAAIIDVESAQNLDLVGKQRGPSSTFSLLGCLDRCSTPMGRRLLRASILQPPCDPELIEGRQSCVAELVADRSFHAVLKPVIKRFYGAGRLLSLAMLTSQADSVQAAERNLDYILLLKSTMDNIPEFRTIMSNGKTAFFKKVHQDLGDPRYAMINQKILSLVHKDARSVSGATSSNMQRCFAIRSGINDMLDVARQTYCELIDDMQSIVEKMSERYRFRISLSYNANLGFHVEIDAPKGAENDPKIKELLSSNMTEVHRDKRTIRATNDYLLALTQQCREASNELHIMSNVLLNQTMSELRENMGCLLKLSDNIGELDLLLSLAQISSIKDYVRPVFDNSLELVQSRHPIMDVLGNEAPVANDVSASSSHNFHTITGPNMSGKSVLLKQIVLLQIMSQIGCYVPAKSAKFRIADRIFSVSTADTRDIESNTSSFIFEIKQARYILQSVTSSSLIVLDELCRSTTVEEGTSIAWAICEKLLHSGAFIFNATHFLHLSRMSEFYYNARDHRMETLPKVDGTLVRTHRILEGLPTITNYGIALARSTGLPESVTTRAARIAEEISKEVVDVAEDQAENSTSRDRSVEKKCYDCVARLARLLEHEDSFNLENIQLLINEFDVVTLSDRLKSSGRQDTPLKRPADDPAVRHEDPPKKMRFSSPAGEPADFSLQDEQCSVDFSEEERIYDLLFADRDSMESLSISSPAFETTP